MAGCVAVSAARAAPQLPAVYATVPPRIDGVLDDPCWTTAAHVEDFYFPNERRAETERTEAWVCVDARNLYAALWCHDSRPDTILMQQTMRGGSLDRDDYAVVHIDPTRRQLEHYSFRVSPRGTQSDTIPNSGSANIAWRGDWTAAAQRVEDGYIVEMAIPFSTLRYPRGQTAFAIAFGRNLERMEEGDYWPRMEDRFEDREMAILGPLQLADPVNRPAVMPYGILGLDGRGPHFQSGLDVRHTFSNDVKLLFTATPDFKNIEDVVETIAYSDTTRFLGETRPFFSEGASLFPGSTSLYTRQIPSVTTGLKCFGEVGGSEFGTFATLSHHGRFDSAADYVYHPTPYLSFGQGAVYHAGDAQPANLVTHSRFSSTHLLGRASLNWGGTLVHSFTAGPGGEGNVYNANINYYGDGVLGWWGNYSVTEPTFRAVDGYVPEPDTRGWGAGVSFSKRSQEHFIQSHYWDVGMGQFDKANGNLLQAWYSADGGVRLASGTSFSGSVFSLQRPPNRDRTISAGFRWGLDTLYDEGGVNVTWGHRGGGRYFFARVNQGWAPIPQVRLGWNSEYTLRRFHDPARANVYLTQNIFTATGELDPYTTLSARLVERHGHLNLFVAYRHAPPSGRGYYIFVGDPNTRETQGLVQVKLIWPL
ncbi:MAG: carbohydrate binding family 9 domain-containing protein [Armatimonadetes bacterium]|nr:carbohydrate binding family 9 domain-containing protein [Armatimonadota bacterium]